MFFNSWAPCCTREVLHLTCGAAPAPGTDRLAGQMLLAAARHGRAIDSRAHVFARAAACLV